MLQVPVSTQYQLYRLFDTAAAAAHELEVSRQQLMHLPKVDVLCTLNNIFTSIAEGRLTVSIADLRRAFANHAIVVTEQEISMLRQRYLKGDSVEVTFAEFARQLTPQQKA